MKELRNIAIGILVGLAVATVWAQPSTVTVTSTAPVGCGAFYFSTKCDTTVGFIPSTSASGASKYNNLTITVFYNPLLQGVPGRYNILEFWGLYSTYAVAHVTSFVDIDTGMKAANGWEIHTQSGTFVSQLLSSPYGDSYAGLFTGSWTATVLVGPTIKPTGCGRGCGPARTQWTMDKLITTINNQ